MKTDAARIAAIARAWPADVRLVLLHGPDEAASRDMAGQVTAGLGAGVTITELAGNALKSDPQALMAAATSLSMFGDRELVRVDGLDDDALAAVEALLEGPPGHPVLAVAGSFKKGSKLLTLADKHPTIAACTMLAGCSPRWPRRSACGWNAACPKPCSKAPAATA